MPSNKEEFYTCQLSDRQEQSCFLVEKEKMILCVAVHDAAAAVAATVLNVIIKSVRSSESTSQSYRQRITRELLIFVNCFLNTKSMLQTKVNISERGKHRRRSLTGCVSLIFCTHCRLDQHELLMSFILVMHSKFSYSEVFDLNFIIQKSSCQPDMLLVHFWSRVNLTVTTFNFELCVYTIIIPALPTIQYFSRLVQMCSSRLCREMLKL